MSWMDSWSRPAKSQATPAPYYLLPGGENTPYCKSCGRVISSRKSQSANETTTTPVAYCGSKCRRRKPGKMDRQIEEAFAALLAGNNIIRNAPSHKKEIGKKAKGDPRVLVPCDAVEELVFGPRHDAKKDRSRRKNKARRAASDDEEWKSAEMVDLDDSTTVSDGGSTVESRVDGDVLARMAVRSGTRVRPPQEVSEVNGSVGGEKGRAERIEETQEMAEKRKQGEKRAEERERVRCAARRGVVFGLCIEGGKGEKEERRKCEAVMQGRVIEPSFAKGDWGIRWRE
ncbi:hypothetical protein P154DRAFT_451340 [Amniculicola lignicola CBS 123094]|uniref:Uncharacterized protein n=1 Tax=Amniculicola lignicola CBS 123094 TaxID=1392246 RepID=A0A6A5VU31_9PLEO|nr:hypothetical protein P154DRAFT_451340 [Amniculicola lignicola CBS 123094]